MHVIISATREEMQEEYSVVISVNLFPSTLPGYQKWYKDVEKIYNQGSAAINV